MWRDRFSGQARQGLKTAPLTTGSMACLKSLKYEEKQTPTNKQAIKEIIFHLLFY